jgi:hypothetical protein
MDDDRHAGVVLDTQSGTIIASVGMPLPSQEEGARVARVVRDRWIGGCSWSDGVHENDMQG